MLERNELHRHQAQMRRRELQLQAAAEISSAASSILSLEELLPIAVELIRDRFDLYYVGIFLSDRGRQWVVLQAGTGEAGRQMLAEGHKLEIGGTSMIGWCVANAQARIALDVGEEAVRFENPLLPKTRSEMALPLVSRGRVIGAMTIQSAEPAAFTQEDVTVLQTMADQLANAIENARLFQERERRITELAIVNEIGQVLATHPHKGTRAAAALELDELLSAVHQQVSRLFDTTNFYIATYKEGDDEWTSAFHLEAGQRQPPARYKVSTGLTGYIIRNHQPILFRCAEENAAFAQAHGFEIIGEMAHSWLGVPLMTADKLVGVMAIQDYQHEDLYDEEDLTLFATVAGQVATALDNLRLLEETQYRARQLETINEVGRAIASVLDLDTVLRQVVDITKARFGHYYVSIMLVEGDQLVFRHGSTVGDSKKRIEPGHTPPQVAIDLHRGGHSPGTASGLRLALCAEAARTGQPVLVDNVLDDPPRNGFGIPPRNGFGIPHFLPVAELTATRSELDVPIEVRGRVIGVLGVQSDRPFAYDQTDVTLLQSLASQAGVAIENARLFQERERRITELAIVNEVGRAVSAVPELEALLETVYERVSHLFDTTNFYIATYGEGSAEWHVALDVESGQRQPPTRHSVDSGLTGYIIRNRRPLLLRDGQELIAFHEEQGVEILGQSAKSWLGVPLIAADRVVGVMAIQSYEQEHLYGEQDLALFSTIAAQVASALENLRLFEETRRRAEELGILHEVSLELAQEQRDLHTALDTITQRVMDLLDSDGGGVWLWQEEDQELELVITYQVGEIDFTGRRLKPGEGLTGRAFAEKKVQVMDDYLAWAGKSPTFLDAPFISGMAAPMVWQAQVVGVLVATRSQPDRPYSAAEQNLAELLAAQAAAAIQNVRLFEQTQARAEELAVLNEMGRALNAMLDVNVILENLYRYATRLMDTTNFYIALYDPGTDMVSFPLAVEHGQRMQWRSRQAGQGLTEYLIRTGESLLIEEDITTRLAGLGIESIGAMSLSWLGVPMRIGDRVIGVIALQSYTTPRLYDERHRDLLSAFGSHAAIAIESARLFEQTQAALAETEGLYLASAELNATQTYDDILDVLRSHTILGEADRSVSISLFDRPWVEDDVPEWVMPVAEWTAGTPTEIEQYALRDFPSAPSLLRADAPTLIADIETDPRLDDNTRALYLQTYGVRSTLAVPLVTAGQWIGYLDGLYTQQAQFPEAEVRRLMVLAGQAAVAIQSLRQLAETQARAEQERLARTDLSKRVNELDCLNDLGRKIDEAPPIPEFLQWVAERIPAAMQYPDLCAVAIELEGQVYGVAEAVSLPCQMVQSLTIRGLKQAGRVIIAYVEEHDFLDEESALLGDVTRRVSGYVENYRLLQDAQARANEQAILAEVAQVLTACQDVDSVLDMVYRGASRLLDATNFYITLFDAQRDEVHFALRVIDGEVEKPGTVRPVGSGGLTDYLLTTRRPLLLSDRVAERVEALGISRIPLTSGRNSVSWLGVPIIVGDQVLGTLVVMSYTTPGAYDDRSQELLVALANQTALALQNVRLLEETRAALAEVEATHRSYLRRGWQEHLRQRGMLERSGFLYDRGKDVIAEPDLWRSEVERALMIGGVATATEGGEDGARTGLAIPIALRGQTLGVLGVELPTADRQWTEDDVALIEAVSDQLAQTLETARLFADTQRRAERERLISEITTKVRASTDIQEILETTAVELGQALGTSQAQVRLSDPDIALTTGAATDRVPAEDVAAPTPEAVPGRSPDAVPEEVSRPHTACQAGLTVPIKLRDQILGVLDLQRDDSLPYGPQQWTEDEIALIQTISDQVALALENVRLLQETSQRAEQLATLHRIGLAVSSALDLDQVLNALYERILPTMDVGSFYVALYDEATGIVEFPLMINEQGRVPVEARSIREEPGVTGYIIQTRQPLHIADSDAIPQDAPYQTVTLDSRHTRSFIGVPLVFRDQVFGVLSVQSYAPNAYSEADVELLTTIASQASIAIQNARAYERLVETAEQLRELDRLKTQFLANMSHELRTPLNSIIGFSRVMLKGIDGPLTELQEADLNSIYNSGQHLLSLINSILDMSKIEAGKMDLVFDEVFLPDIFRAVVSTTSALVKDHPIELRSEVPDDLPAVWADAQRVRQVLINLMSNAVKFTEKGHITLRAEPGPEFVTISVSDTGIGIDKEAQQRLFIPFQQVDASTTRRAGGTGLGLAISHSFVEMHGGTIWVESEPGQGSTFFFTLPIYEVAHRKESFGEASDMALSTDKKVVLVVDDDAGVITLLKRYLQADSGYQVVGVMQPHNAMEMAQRLAPDLAAITLDVVMPHMDGWQVLRALKQDPQTKDIPVILCSIVEGLEQGLSMGAAACLRKPFTQNEILDMLRKVEQQAAHREEPRP